MIDTQVGTSEVSPLRLPQISTRRSAGGFDFSVISSNDGFRVMSLNRNFAHNTPDRYYANLIDQKPDIGRPLFYRITFREGSRPPVIRVAEIGSADPALKAQLLDPATDAEKLLKMRAVSTDHVPVGEQGHDEGIRYNRALYELLTGWTGPGKEELQTRLSGAKLGDLIETAERSTVPR